ncbi:hypothetical protein Nepgr_020763 [Nepenthes gracilis]|uniref:Uncharacterized protein n=1 Tax=Nepenthes gracilis TaxID=150966 RepID=A0AAD3SXJ3_NEPGR|nr:hypothetical protein Nepgr_020763 [Nepenthes gracilis]
MVLFNSLFELFGHLMFPFKQHPGGDALLRKMGVLPLGPNSSVGSEKPGMGGGLARRAKAGGRAARE